MCTGAEGHRGENDWTPGSDIWSEAWRLTSKGIMVSTNSWQKEQHKQKLLDMNSHYMACELWVVWECFNHRVYKDTFENRDTRY